MFTKHLKNFFTSAILIAGLVSGVSLLQAADSDNEKRKLVILNWSEYMDPAIIKKFEDEHDVDVQEVYFESDDYRDNYMLETQGEGIDIVVVNGIQMRLYKKQGWIVPITEKEVPNLKYIDRKWLTLFEDADGFAVPYFWGTSGIVYRKDLIKREINSFSDLLNPDEEWAGKIAMVGSSRDLIGMALKSLGYSLNSTSYKELEEAKHVLLQQKPYVKEYAYINLDETSSLLNGDIYISMVYSGDALMLQEHDENIGYVVPEEGSELWVDQLTVTSASKHRELAYRFLNFINEPEVAAQMAEYVYYASPNMEAEKLLPEDFKADDVIYPPQAVLDKCEVYARLPPRVTRIRNEIFSTVTR